MASKAAIPGLRKALSDGKPAVALAAAHALQLLSDPAGYEVYYEVLTGERKSAEGVVAPANAAIATGNERDFVFELAHEFLPKP